MDVNCMSCLVKLARGCPTNGKTMAYRGVVCAMVRAATNASPPGTIGLPAHLFEWNAIASRWMSFEGLTSRWVTREQ